MARLTTEYCGEYVPRELCVMDRQGGADDCELCYESCKAMEEGNADCTGCAISQCFNKLGEYENLEEQGKLLKLPAAIGDEIFYAYHDCPTSYDKKYCTDHEGGCEKCNHRTAEILKRKFDISDLKYLDSIYPTREAAEAALNKLAEDNEWGKHGETD